MISLPRYLSYSRSRLFAYLSLPPSSVHIGSKLPKTRHEATNACSTPQAGLAYSRSRPQSTVQYFPDLATRRLDLLYREGRYYTKGGLVDNAGGRPGVRGTARLAILNPSINTRCSDRLCPEMRRLKCTSSHCGQER